MFFLDKYTVSYEKQYGFLQNKFTTNGILKFADQRVSNSKKKTQLNNSSDFLRPLIRWTRRFCTKKKNENAMV